MSIPTNPTRKDPERAFALQKYLLLHSQHDALRKHLQQITTSFPSTANESPYPSSSRMSRHSSTSSTSSTSPSPSASPISPTHPIDHRSTSMTQSPTRPRLISRRSSLPTLPNEHTISSVEEDETKLKAVNQQIKNTLTELLNCESVRGDQRYRMWVQTRLMGAERELRGERTRRGDRRGSLGEGIL